MINFKNFVKECLSSPVFENTNIPEDKKNQVIEVSTNCIISLLKKNFVLDNFSMMKDLLSMGYIPMDNAIVHDLKKTVELSLSKTVELKNEISNKIAPLLVSNLLVILSKKVCDPKDTDYELSALMGEMAYEEKKDKKEHVCAIEGTWFG